MTFKEKLQKEHPEEVGAQFIGGCNRCPDDYGYEEYARCSERLPEFVGDDSRRCRACWNRTIPGTEKPKTFNFKPEGLNALIERVATKKDISVTIFITGDSQHISVYPCPDPSEKQGNPVAEAYKILVASGYRLNGISEAIRKLEEALE